MKMFDSIIGFLNEFISLDDLFEKSVYIVVRHTGKHAEIIEFESEN